MLRGDANARFSYKQRLTSLEKDLSMPIKIPTSIETQNSTLKKTPRHAAPRHASQKILTQLYPSRLIKRDLRRRLHALRILIESTISLMALFLNSSSVLHQFLRNRLASRFENIDESAGKVLLGFAEESDRAAVLACAAGTGRGC
jgi:hypothetical protein